MLLANELVARELKHQKQPTVYRIHENPDPEKLLEFREFAASQGIHAGDLETSVMLALKPSTVQMQHARRFESLTERMALDNRFLSITPSGKLGWQTQDLNPEGACGDASAATADKGRAVLDFVSDRFVELLREVQRHDLALLDNQPPWG